MKRKLGILAGVLFLAQLLVIFFSWMIAAIMPELSVHSLLSSEGIRWLFGSFTNNQQPNILMWIILLSIVLGFLYKSGLYEMLKFLLLSIFNKKELNLHYLQKIGLVVITIETVVFIAIIISLAFIPHAILLSVIGELLPSSFALNIIPSISFFILVASASYGGISQKIRTFGMMYEFLVYGVKKISYILPIYLLLNQLISSIIFVLK